MGRGEFRWPIIIYCSNKELKQKLKILQIMWWESKRGKTEFFVGGGRNSGHAQYSGFVFAECYDFMNYCNWKLTNRVQGGGGGIEVWRFLILHAGKEANGMERGGHFRGHLHNITAI